MIANVLKKVQDLHARFKAWKPIHLCWWFEKHGLPIPPYLIGGASDTHQRYYRIGTDNGNTDPDSQTWETENAASTKAKGTPFFIRICASEEGGGNVNNVAFGLWYSTSPTAGGTTQVTTSSNVVRIVNDPGSNITDLTATDNSTVLTTPSGASSGYVAGQYVDASDTTGAISISNRLATDIQFCVQFMTDASDGQTYYFYLRASGAALNNYEAPAQVGAQAASSSSSYSSSSSSTSSSQSSSSSSTSSSSTSSSSTSSSSSMTPSSSSSSTSSSSFSSSSSSASSSSSSSSTSSSSFSSSSSSSTSSSSSSRSSSSMSSSSMSSSSVSSSSSSTSSSSTSSSSAATHIYSRGDVPTLPSDDTELATPFTTTDYDYVEADDTDYVNQTAVSIAVFLFKYKNPAEQSATITWKGQTDLAPSTSTVYLQIYNYTLTQWETLGSNNSSSANIDFTLTGFKAAGATDYYDAQGYMALRTYQELP